MKTTGKLILTFFCLFEIESNLMNGCPLIFLLNLLLEYFRYQIKYSLNWFVTSISDTELESDESLLLARPAWNKSNKLEKKNLKP